jgi:hypothetical protein
VQRRVSCRGALVVAKQRIHVGIVHAGRTLTVEAADATWRVHIIHGGPSLNPASPPARYAEPGRGHPV